MQDEINVRDLLIPLVKGKRTIFITTIITLICSLLLHYFVMDKVYESTALITINDRSETDVTTNTIDLTSFTQQVTSSFAMDKLIKDLGLNQGRYNVDSLKKSLNIETFKNSNLIKITVKGNDPKTIVNISNYIANQIGANIEISKRMDMVVEYKIKVIKVQDDIKIVKSSIDEANKQLKDIPNILETQRLLADQPYLQSVIGEGTNTSEKALGALQLKNQEINPVYINLQVKLTEAQLQLSKLESEEKGLVDRINQTEKLIVDLKSSVNKYEQLETNVLGGITATFITPSVEPSKPTSPNLIINLLAGLMVGIVASVVYVYIQEGNLRYKQHMTHNKSV